MSRSAADNGHAAPPSGSPRDRVILVGRTGFDGELRRDDSIELRRARTAMEAIGELADPDLGENGADASVAVIIAPEADPGVHAAAFIDGLRLVNPHVRVLLAGEESSPPYHGAICGEGIAAQIRAITRPAPAATPPPPIPRQVVTVPPPAPASAPPAPVPAPPTAARQVSPAQPVASAAPPVPGVSLDDDVSLLEWLMAGRDLLLPAMQLIRQRTGCTDVVFVPAGASAVAPTPPTVATPTADAAQTPVVFRSRCQGWLSSRRLEPHALAPHAAWLAHWLALRDQQDQLRRAAFTDDLTGAFNRRYFDRFLAAAIDQSRTDRYPLTVLYFDIDNFKQYNDRYGHGAGDEILRETVRLLKSVIRPTDRVCRIGGDEFAVIFHEPEGPRDPASKPPASVRDIAHRFQRQVCEHRFPKLAEQAPGTLTISGGLATFPWDGDTPEKLLERADELAIQSKRQGKNAITLGPGAERVCGT
jgi:diguanylate cyclase (GGDEF)-like protein